MKYYFDLVKKLRDAYDYSSRQTNLFEPTVKRMFKGCETFYADGELYYVLDDGSMFITPSLDPWKCEYKPHFFTSDGSIIEL